MCRTVRHHQHRMHLRCLVSVGCSNANFSVTAAAPTSARLGPTDVQYCVVQLPTRNCLMNLLPQTKEEVHVFARVCFSVCLSVSKITQKRVHGFR